VRVCLNYFGCIVDIPELSDLLVFVGYGHFAYAELLRCLEANGQENVSLLPLQVHLVPAGLWVVVDFDGMGRIRHCSLLVMVDNVGINCALGPCKD
jgi:hypothetical protein